MYKKKQFVDSLKKEDLVNDIFVVKFKKPVEPYKNGYKFELRLGDKTKEIMFKFWGPDNEELVKQTFDKIKQDDFVLIQGRVNEWNNNLEISSNDPEKIQVLSPADVALEDFLPHSDKNIEEMYKELYSYINLVEDTKLKTFLEHLFSDKDFNEKFKSAPAALYRHHGWVGGLLEHTLNVLTTCYNYLNVNQSLDKDLLITGAIIHDIGKVDEFQMTSSIKVSQEGMLLGHIISGVERIAKTIEHTDLDYTLTLKLKHFLVSHHGELEKGSLKTPCFPEATLVHYSDEMDSMVSQIQKVKDHASTEDDYLFHRDFGNVFLR